MLVIELMTQPDDSPLALSTASHRERGRLHFIHKNLYRHLSPHCFFIEGLGIRSLISIDGVLKTSQPRYTSAERAGRGRE
eukprot:scaffold3301_cov127-Alexandrium_tamarense.AAC.2